MLILFDCDGVLVDSEVLVIELESEMLAALGVRLTPAEISSSYAGLADSLMHDRIERDFDVRLPADFAARKWERMQAILRAELVPVAGIVGVLDALTSPSRVASSSSLERVELSLEATGLATRFAGRVSSGDMVERLKPAPDLFLHAAAQEGVDPGECVVVEDSTHGVAAAVAAGMRVIGFTAGRHCGGDLGSRLLAAGADTVVPDAATLRSELDR